MENNAIRLYLVRARINIILSESFELPSLEEIDEVERQRSQAIEALEISGNSVKCQRCGMAVTFCHLDLVVVIIILINHAK